MRDVVPVKFYSDEGFVEYKLEINDDDSEQEQAFEAGRLGAEVKVSGPYDDNPTGR